MLVSDAIMRISVIISVAVTAFRVVTFGQETSLGDAQTLLPMDAPPLIPDPSLEPGGILVEPAPVTDQPALFPRRDIPIPARTTERVEQLTRDPAFAAGVPIDEAEIGAASAFGYNSEGIGSATRPSVAGTQAEREMARIISRAERQSNLEHYNLKIGPIPFRFGAGVEFQFSDNVNLSKRDKLADLSAVPHIDMYGGIRLSRQNTLSIQLGLGYIWSLNRPEQNRVLTNASVGLDTDSGISFDIKAGNFRINLHERPAIPRQQFDLITQRNPLQYSQFTNTAGLSVFWDANTRLSASFQYDHLNIISLKSEVENLDQSSDMIGLSANYRFSDAFSLGAQANASRITYKREFLNESNNNDVGLTLAVRTSRNTNIRLLAGYQVGDFGSGAEVSDNSSVSDWYFRMSINHAINRYLSQSLTFGRETQVGIASNSTKVDYLRHQFNLTLSPTIGISASASYDSAKESGGIFAQEFKVYQFGVYGYWTMAKKLSLALSYRFVKRDTASDENEMLGSLSYDENRIDLGIQVHL